MEALAFIVPLAIALASIWYLIKMSREARERYGFGMVRNWSFLLIVLAMIFAFFAAVHGDMNNQDNMIVLTLAAIASVGGAAWINIKRSTPKFGAVFTLLQVVAAVGIIVPIILFFSHRSAMRGINNMN